MQVEDSGKRSMHREVQGLAEDDERYGQKTALMTSIFEANLAFKRASEGRRAKRVGIIAQS